MAGALHTSGAKENNMAIRVKFGYYVQNNGDGSASVLFFKNEESAEAYAGDDDERFTDGDCGTQTLEFDEEGNLLTPERKKEVY